jgi:glutamine amidotransferase
MAIPDELFANRQGTTDSEAIFLLMLARGLDRDPAQAVSDVVTFIESEMARAGLAEPLKVTAAFTDGTEMHALRYATDGMPPTLYTKACCPTGGTLVVSEPLDEVRDGWSSVPAQCLVTVTAHGVIHKPFAPLPAGRVAA